MTLPLAGRTVALAEGRQLEELAQMLEKEGATTWPCPLVSILDVADAAPVVAWLNELIAGRFALLILLTGEGLRRLLGFAERAGLRDAFLAALRKVPTLTRGPKPGKALKDVGLSPTEVASAPTTDGVIATLRNHDLKGLTVGVQLYSASNPPLTDFLASAGAEARTVLPYVYAPKSDAPRVLDLIDRLARGEVDVLVFTSSPQIDRLYEVAAENGREEALRQGLARTCVAAVGPIVAENLRERGAKADVCPEQGWQMKNLVQHIKRAMGGQEDGEVTRSFRS